MLYGKMLQGQMLHGQNVAWANVAWTNVAWSNGTGPLVNSQGRFHKLEMSPQGTFPLGVGGVGKI